MKVLRLIPIFFAIFLYSCNGCNNEADKITTSDTVSNLKIDTTQNLRETTNIDLIDTTTEKKPEPPPPPPSESREPAKPSKDPGILAKIDKYLVSTSKFTPGPNGGITQAIVTIKNTLPNATFQKAMLEVTILNPDNSLVSSDYYNVVNIEPGESKQVNIRDSPKGSKIVVHVVKIRSKELSNGESVNAGSLYQQQ